MQNQKIYVLREAARKAHQNYLQTKSDIAYQAWRRLLKELRATIEELQKQRD